MLSRFKVLRLFNKIHVVKSTLNKKNNNSNNYSYNDYNNNFYETNSK